MDARYITRHDNGKNILITNHYGNIHYQRPDEVLVLDISPNGKYVQLKWVDQGCRKSWESISEYIIVDILPDSYAKYNYQSKI